MSIDLEALTPRDKLILSGLYLSKYDLRGLKQLGFSGFTEAFNIIGFGLGSQPSTIKNYRDEFDPVFPNPRKGWRKRPVRDYCLRVLEASKDLDFGTFTQVVMSFFATRGRIGETGLDAAEEESLESSFAKRLTTGLAAERYFEAVFSSLLEFTGYSAMNTTQLGCGYDYRLLPAEKKKRVLAVEIKGLSQPIGTISLTQKEHATARELKDRYFLFVVKNFRKSPSHEIFQNPLSSRLQFTKCERLVVQVTWTAGLQGETRAPHT